MGIESALGNVVGAFIGADASRKAANIGADATRYAIDKNAEQFDKTVALQEPWRQAGIGSLSQLTAGTADGGDFNRDFTMADFNADPGYAFRLQQGQSALESSAAARGGLLSGGAGKALVNYGQQAGSQEYGNAYNRFNADRDRRFNRLSDIAGLGQTATRDVTRAGADSARTIGDLYTQGANARASGVIGQANAWNQGIQGLGNWWQQQQPKSGGSSWGTQGLNNFFYGNGTTGD